jgi:hypothetical protein
MNQTDGIRVEKIVIVSYPRNRKEAREMRERERLVMAWVAQDAAVRHLGAGLCAIVASRVDE